MSDYVLDLVFNKHICKDGSVIYWRDCILQTDMEHGEQGYMWIFENGEHLHSYRTPEMCNF